MAMGRLICPGAGRRGGAMPNQEDYVYINWEPFFGTNNVPNNYPLLYDRRLSNHKGLGINVVTPSACFWDYGARWVKGFAVNHPEYNLEIPN
jgi:hypothetical protein